jgi:GNAT superfamily N-acetyltransferase/nitroimidazol reductase NimA-like FMN-containing flavoprotein (pyridoxamine 5'-phosphate oxidase superfamily)
MRRATRATEPGLARALFARAPFVHLASTLPDGTPVLRALNGVVVDAWGDVCFHGATVGEKTGCVGRAAVMTASEAVASIPSWFTDPTRACPATTWFRSAMVHGVLEEVVEPADKAAVLQALMRRFQPEGGHREITADDRHYAAALRGVQVVRLRSTRWEGKQSLGQDKPVETRAVVREALWRRGAPGDDAALAATLALEPEPWPAPLHGPEGVRLWPTLGPDRWDDAERLIALAEWQARIPRDVRMRSLAGGLLVGATRGDRLIATARAVTDGARFAWIADVFVDEPERGRGVGRALVTMLLDHPQVRGCARVLLRTNTAEALYGSLGFRTFADHGVRPWMGLER